MRLISKILVLGFTASLLTSCAAIVEGKRENIAIETNPPQAANCTLSNKLGSWNSVSPTPTRIRKSKTDLNVVCVNPSYGYSGAKTVESKVEPWFWGNIVLGGLIGMTYDAATASMWDYPDSILVTMTPGQPAAPVYSPQSYTPMNNPAVDTTPPAVTYAPAPAAAPAPTTYYYPPQTTAQPMNTGNIADNPTYKPADPAPAYTAPAPTSYNYPSSTGYAAPAPTYAPAPQPAVLDPATGTYYYPNR